MWPQQQVAPMHAIMQPSATRSSNHNVALAQYHGHNQLYQGRGGTGSAPQQQYQHYHQPQMGLLPNPPNMGSGLHQQHHQHLQQQSAYAQSRSRSSGHMWNEADLDAQLQMLALNGQQQQQQMLMQHSRGQQQYVMQQPPLQPPPAFLQQFSHPPPPIMFNRPPPPIAHFVQPQPPITTQAPLAANPQMRPGNVVILQRPRLPQAQQAQQAQQPRPQQQQHHAQMQQQQQQAAPTSFSNNSPHSIESCGSRLIHSDQGSLSPSNSTCNGNAMKTSTDAILSSSSKIPPEQPQKLTILKRPSSSPSNLSSQDGTGLGRNGQPKPQVKSLQQREAEYAQARLRILGSTGTEDEEKANGSMSKDSSAPTSAHAPNSVDQSEETACTSTSPAPEDPSDDHVVGEIVDADQISSLNSLSTLKECVSLTNEKVSASPS